MSRKVLQRLMSCFYAVVESITMKIIPQQWITREREKMKPFMLRTGEYRMVYRNLCKIFRRRKKGISIDEIHQIIGLLESVVDPEALQEFLEHVEVLKAKAKGEEIDAESKKRFFIYLSNKKDKVEEPATSHTKDTPAVDRSVNDSENQPNVLDKSNASGNVSGSELDSASMDNIINKKEPVYKDKPKSYKVIGIPPGILPSNTMMRMYRQGVKDLDFMEERVPEAEPKNLLNMVSKELEEKRKKPELLRPYTTFADDQAYLQRVREKKFSEFKSEKRHSDTVSQQNEEYKKKPFEQASVTENSLSKEKEESYMEKNKKDKETHFEPMIPFSSSRPQEKKGLFETASGKIIEPFKPSAPPAKKEKSQEWSSKGALEVPSSFGSISSPLDGSSGIFNSSFSLNTTLPNASPNASSFNVSLSEAPNPILPSSSDTPHKIPPFVPSSNYTTEKKPSPEKDSSKSSIISPFVPSSAATSSTTPTTSSIFGASTTPFTAFKPSTIPTTSTTPSTTSNTLSTTSNTPSTILSTTPGSGGLGGINSGLGSTPIPSPLDAFGLSSSVKEKESEQMSRNPLNSSSSSSFTNPLGSSFDKFGSGASDDKAPRAGGELAPSYGAVSSSPSFGAPVGQSTGQNAQQIGNLFGAQNMQQDTNSSSLGIPTLGGNGGIFGNSKNPFAGAAASFTDGFWSKKQEEPAEKGFANPFNNSSTSFESPLGGSFSGPTNFNPSNEQAPSPFGAPGGIHGDPSAQGSSLFSGGNSETGGAFNPFSSQESVRRKRFPFKK
ncbi:hypothetical protein NEFER01_0176 [Nematocida sp. LUAm1]|nr:hypothetical protein NEFER02_0146 [Nematocida sp. LUAm2]KAI5176851.1 hypothetical protein NEFER01_0176 [Nematocida sp. LUAm1]